MVRDLLKGGEGRFFRGNLHCHSDRSDGQRSPEYVAGAYRDAGYDFLCLSDHLEAEYGWQVTDTRPSRDEGFTTILGAELSSGPWEDRHTFWVAAAGLPADFEAPTTDDHAGAIARARDAGAYLVMLHPGLNNLPLAAAARLPALEAVHAVEVYNHHMATLAHPDAANGAYMLDGLLEEDRRLLVNAGDDAHFDDPKDRFGGWIEVFSERLEPEYLLASLKAGRYYATQGPAFRGLQVDAGVLHVETSEAFAISLTTGGDRWQSGTEHHGGAGTVSEADFDLAPFRGTYCRVIVVDTAGRRAWSNPIWPSPPRSSNAARGWHRVWGHSFRKPRMPLEALRKFGSPGRAAEVSQKHSRDKLGLRL